MLETPESHAGDGTREAWPKEWGDWKTTERIQNLFTKTQNFSEESQKSTAVVLCTVEVHNNSTGYQKPIASNSHNRPMSRLFYDGYHLFQIADFNANVSILKSLKKMLSVFLQKKKRSMLGFQSTTVPLTEGGLSVVVPGCTLHYVENVPMNANPAGRFSRNCNNNIS